MENDKMTEMYLTTIKELFVKCKNNRKELSKSLYKYLIPLEADKNEYSEVSTPYEIRYDMLETVNPEFWKKIRI